MRFCISYSRTFVQSGDSLDGRHGTNLQDCRFIHQSPNVIGAGYAYAWLMSANLFSIQKQEEKIHMSSLDDIMSSSLRGPQAGAVICTDGIALEYGFGGTIYSGEAY